MDVLAFQRKWIDASRQKERSAYVTHFTDLCDLLGVDKPLDADPTGATYGFEKGSKIAGGGDGWADVWYKGHFAWEYKGIGKDLDAAYVQLLRYKDDLGNPPLLVVCDLNTIRIHTNFTNSVKRTIEVDLAGLSDEGVLPMLRRMWTDPEHFRPTETPDSVTIAAAGRFSAIAAGLHARGEDPAASAHFIMQMVFCLFAEDIRLLPDRLFSQMVAADRNDPAQFQADARELLEAMNTGGRVAYKRVPHVNGGLFATADVPRLTAEEIALLHEASALDWSAIEPAIFGTLFERSLDPAKRSQLGAHYTGKADIERVVEPVVMAPLRRRWADLRAKQDPDPQFVGEELVSSRSAEGRYPDAARPPAGRQSRTGTRRRNAMLRDVDAFLADLRAVRVLDPACGSGNFLYVALSHLLSLEKEVMTFRALNGGTALGLPEVSPKQVMGIEINEYARELAQVAIWIGYLQWMIDNGFGWGEPVLAPLETIRLQDALLAFHEDGTVTEAAWPEADYIIGNPPFLGDKVMRRELGDGYVDALRRAYGEAIPGGADLCCYFFEHARMAIGAERADRAGLLATTTIRFGANRAVLGRIKASGDIFMAWPDEPWTLEGANVRIAIVGFDDGNERSKFLAGQSVSHINADLTSATDLTVARPLAENRGVAFLGVCKGGPFDITNVFARELLSLPPNPNGRPNSDVVRRRVNGQDITGRPRNGWIVDFGPAMTQDEAALYEAPFEYILRTVKPVRDVNRDKSLKKYWWLPQRSRPELREALRGHHRFIVTPAVSKHRLFVWIDSSVIPDHKLVVFARDDDYFFGLLHARPHELWSLALSTKHGGERPTYTPTTCFDNYPFPWPPSEEPVDDPRVVAIAQAAKRLNELRERWLNPEGASDAELKKRTLTNLYNERPTWLRNAHAALDRAVWDAYGWPADEVPAEVEEDVILSRLLALNGERATGR